MTCQKEMIKFKTALFSLYLINLTRFSGFLANDFQDSSKNRMNGKINSNRNP